MRDSIVLAVPQCFFSGHLVLRLFESPCSRDLTKNHDSFFDTDWVGTARRPGLMMTPDRYLARVKHEEEAKQNQIVQYTPRGRSLDIGIGGITTRGAFVC